MGGLFGREIEKGVVKATSNTDKKVEIYAELCASWGYGSVRSEVIFLINEISKRGFEVIYTIDPKAGARGEYFVFIVKGEEKIPIFSNNQKLHPNAFYGDQISNKNAEAIIKKIEN